MRSTLRFLHTGIGLSSKLLWVAYGGLYRAGRWALYRSGLMETAVRGAASSTEQAIRRLLFHQAAHNANPVVIDGHVLVHGPRDYWSTPEPIAGRYEPEVSRVISQLLKPGMQFVDAGANIGYFTLLGARCVGRTGKVYAFEPNPPDFSRLCKNVEENGYSNVVIVNAAISSGGGFVDFFLAPDGCSSIHRRRGVDGFFGKVPTVSLDDFFAERNWPPVDLVKMDIEGNEKAALVGLAELSQRSSNLKLIVEFSPLTMAAAGVTPEELIETIRAAGLARIFHIENKLTQIISTKDVLALAREARVAPTNLLCEKETE